MLMNDKDPLMNFDLGNKTENKPSNKPADTSVDKQQDEEPEMKMTYSAIVAGADGKKIVRVLFERTVDGQLQTAEGVLPEAKIVKQNGYEEKEVAAMEFYLSQNSEDIMKKAKVISNPLHWF